MVRFRVYVPLAVVALLALLVLVYCYVILPQDLGLGLAGAYAQLGGVTFGLLLTFVWLVVTTLVVWRAVRFARSSSEPGALSIAAVTVLLASIVLVTSYPLVVLYMYVSLDTVMPEGQLPISVPFSRIYWWLVALSIPASLAAAVILLRRAVRSRQEVQ